MAHRGASATHPENTLPAFEAAVVAGADVVELDVRLSADGVAVVLHDGDVSSTTDGSGQVHDLTLRRIKELDASGGRGLAVPVPTLDEALRHLSGRAGIDIEIKNVPGEPSFDSTGEAAAHEVARVLRGFSFEGPVVVTSFHRSTIDRFRELAPDVPTGLISSVLVEPAEALTYARRAGHAVVLPQAPALFEHGRGIVDRAHSLGIRVGTWTVDDPAAMEQLFEMGVDAIATNDPVAAVPVRDRFRPA